MIFQEKLPTKPRFKKDTLIELSYGYHTPLAIHINQDLTASKHYDLIARIPIHSSYGAGYFWVWSKHAGESGLLKTLFASQYTLGGRAEPEVSL
jgi:hypothetical protein